MTIIYRDYDHLVKDMQARIIKFRDQCRRISQLFDKGKISRMQAKYAEQLIILDFALHEAQGLIQFDETDHIKRRCIESLTDARISLDAIAAYATSRNNSRIYSAAQNRYESVLNELNSYRGGSLN